MSYFSSFIDQGLEWYQTSGYCSSN